ncbi:hypothetical protein [Tumidithrix helvetica]|uniref:hypothetical protein n=1 Tax=Tumidithrix helvetica TaxID=3457545 RepID=UPI003CC699DD
MPSSIGKDSPFKTQRLQFFVLIFAPERKDELGGNLRKPQTHVSYILVKKYIHKPVIPT